MMTQEEQLMLYILVSDILDYPIIREQNNHPLSSTLSLTLPLSLSLCVLPLTVHEVDSVHTLELLTFVTYPDTQQIL